MFQLPFPVTGLAPAAGGGRAPDTSGLNDLMQAVEGSPGAFSGELQALLMQLSPPLLRRLDALVAGGMSLPQAAGSLLAGPEDGDPSLPFSPLIKDGDVGGLSRADTNGTQALAGRDAPLMQLIGQVFARGDAANNPAQALYAAIVPGPGGAEAQLPPQLASKLLHMGVPQPVGGGGWDSAVADRVIWMVQGEQQVAKLTLNPPNLGPLEVRVAVSNDQTSVTFLAHQAVVREALEAALPRLREMFDQQSLQLVRAEVSDPGSRQGRESDGSDGRMGSAADDTGGDAGQEPKTATASPVSDRGASLVDLFV